ncbi:hypothetical protein SNARM312S_01734 [Streptomyces narbonensis]
MMRHLISTADLTRDDAVLILDTAEEMARVADRPIKKLPTLRGRTISATCSSRTPPGPGSPSRPPRSASPPT